jgi:anti-sigma regulatory factor (Ser/Thr protein kinase)
MVRTDLDSGALILSLRPDHSDEQVRAAVDASAGQHPAGVVLELGPTPARWTMLLRTLAHTCARHAVPLLVVPVLVAPGPSPVRSLAIALPISHHTSVAAALAGLPSAGVPAAHRRRLHLPATPTAAGRARAVVARTLTDWGLEDLLFPVELVTSELVSNAVRHAGTEADLLLGLGPGGVRVAVRDGEPSAPILPAGPSDVPREGGRGILLVSALAQRWGVLTGSHDKIVWAEVRPASRAGQDLGSGDDRSVRRDR